MRIIVRLILVIAVAVHLLPALAADRPNVLWIVVDDMSADVGYYGSAAVPTPHVDRMAAEGTRFAHAFVTAPVCSPCRSALITGMYQTTIGAHHHRSGRGLEKIRLPAGVRPVPAIFHEAGWYTCIGDGLPEGVGKPRGRPQGLGKTDYNFEWDAAIYDGEDWAGRQPGQPFFMQVQLPGGKLRDGKGGLERVREQAEAAFGKATDPETVTLPPYLPRDPVLLADRAAYLDTVRLTDAHVGRVLARLEAEGILETTLVIFMTDHGISHVRAKQFLYDEGTHVPFIVRGPGIPQGQVREDLIEHIDMPAISLAAAGLPIPAVMQGRDVFAKGYEPRTAVFAARDRCDETVDRIRSVRTPDWLYIRNFHPGPAREDAPPQDCLREPRELARVARSRPAARAGIRRGRTPRLSRVRHPLLRLRPRGLHDVPHGIRRGILLQGPRRLPVLQRSAHGERRPHTSPITSSRRCPCGSG